MISISYINYLNGDVQKNQGSPGNSRQQVSEGQRLHVFQPLGGNQLREKCGQVENERVELVGKVDKESLDSVDLPMLELF